MAAPRQLNTRSKRTAWGLRGPRGLRGPSALIPPLDSNQIAQFYLHINAMHYATLTGDQKQSPFRNSEGSVQLLESDRPFLTALS